MVQRPDPKLPSASHVPPAGEAGSVQPFVVVGLGSLLLLLGFTINLGQLFSATSQLQASADAAARAAANEISNQVLKDPNVPMRTLRDEATAMARGVLEQRRVISSTGTNVSVEFGAYDFRERIFALGPEAIQPTAVRVTVQPQSSSGGSAVRLLMPTSEVSNVELSRTSVSALRTTNQVFLVDVSISFEDSIGLVKKALQRHIDSLVDRGGVERVGIIPFRNRIVESRVVGLVEPTDPKIRSTINALDAPGVLCESSGGTGFPLPDCAGTDVAGALDAALAMVGFQGANPSNTVINLLTDGEPCEVSQELVQSLLVVPPQPPGTTFVSNPLDPNTGGGSSADEAREAARRLCQTASLNTIAIDTAGGLCPSLTPTVEFKPLPFPFSLKVKPPNGPEQDVFFKETSRDDELMSEMVCNFGRNFPSDTTEDGLVGELRRAASTLPPVTVQ